MLKKVWRDIASVEFNTKQKQLLSQHYSDAYRIAYSFKAPQIADDVRETIAFNALQCAVKAFDKTKHAKFTTLLYLCVYNSLKSEVQRLQRQPHQISEIQDSLTSEYVSIFNILSAKESAPYDWNRYDQFVRRLKQRLDERRQLILDMLINPETYLSKHTHDFKIHKIPKRMTYSVIAKRLGKSVSKVSCEMKIIRQEARQVLEELDRV